MTDPDPPAADPAIVTSGKPAATREPRSPVQDHDVAPFLEDRTLPLPNRPDRRELVRSPLLRRIDTRTTSAAPSPDSLREVLRSIITVHPSSGSGSGGREFGSGGAEEAESVEGAGSIDVSDLILDSETAGAILRTLVDVKSTDGQFTTFSVLGFGDFVVETASGAHGATLSELSTGRSVTLLSGENSYAASSGTSEAETGAPGERVDEIRLALRWVIDFLSSPLGVLLVMMAILIAFLWSVVKSVAMLQHSTARARRRRRHRTY